MDVEVKAVYLRIKYALTVYNNLGMARQAYIDLQTAENARACYQMAIGETPDASESVANFLTNNKLRDCNDTPLELSNINIRWKPINYTDDSDMKIYKLKTSKPQGINLTERDSSGKIVE